MQPILSSIESRNVIRWVDDIGHHLIKKIEIFIGGELVSSTSDLDPWFQFYDEIVNQANPPNSDQIPTFKTNTLLLK